jgi:hypothetical protein
VHEIAPSAGVHTCHTHDCMNLVQVLLTWHSTLYNRHPLHMIATYKYRLLWEGWARERAECQTSAAAFTEARSFIQAPALPALPLCAEALGFSVSY